jgi:hypothetical protein
VTILVSLLIGTLPWIDNFAHLGTVAHCNARQPPVAAPPTPSAHLGLLTPSA